MISKIWKVNKRMRHRSYLTLNPTVKKELELW